MLVNLKFRQQLERANHKIRTVYFIEAGLASVVISTGDGKRRDAESCVIGHEGMTGIAGSSGVEHLPARLPFHHARREVRGCDSCY